MEEGPKLTVNQNEIKPTEMAIVSKGAENGKEKEEGKGGEKKNIGEERCGKANFNQGQQPNKVIS